MPSGVTIIIPTRLAFPSRLANAVGVPNIAITAAITKLPFSTPSHALLLFVISTVTSYNQSLICIHALNTHFL